MSSSDLVSRPVELELISRVLGNDIFLNWRLQTVGDRHSGTGVSSARTQPRGTFGAFVASASAFVCELKRQKLELKYVMSAF